ncbi:unnamed protein product [Mytilus edulis]|uniref:DNA-directed DNA polymerase n=1 Tax=Mytilus edulis TaxID=6550 RepID=A0A8S3V836_MYTED|nr:unnamed protein product [Mytilus edulis]
MDASTVMDEISKVLQSNEELPVDDSFSVTVGRIDIPSGGGRVYITKLTGDDNSLKRKRSIISRPSDTMCMPMAISVCFLKTCRVVSPREWKTLTSDDTECMTDKVLKHRTTPKWFYNHVLDKGRKECINFAKRLCALADVSTEKQCNINDIERFEKVVDLQILVISSKLGNKFIRVGEGETDRKRKVLVREERPPELHQCGEWKCVCCRDYQPEEHLCYQRAINTERTDRQMIFFDCETTQDTLLQCENGNLPSTSRCQNCKDKEEACNQCTLCQNCGKSWCGSKEHKVNFICMQTACDHCKDKQISDEPKCNFCGVRCSMCDKKDKKEFKKEPCFKTCGFRERIFRGELATDAFCRRVFSEQYTNAVVLSHNGSGYDNYFLIDWLIKNSIRPDVIFNGSKIMYMAINRGLNIRVLDSLNFYR